MIFLSIGKRVKDFVRVRIYSYHSKGKLVQGSADNSAGDPSASRVTRSFFGNGQVKMETSHKNGKLDGMANFFYESGKIKAREFYKDDQIHGLSKWYYETGEIKSERYYKNGLLISRKDFDKTGRLLRNDLD
ncbi:MAG: toxin-antitoxin system YwqK family antitoxin [Methanococcaceae archaeon]